MNKKAEKMKLTVEMFGLSPFTEANSVDVEVQGGASMTQLLEATRRKMPSLLGHVIQSGGKLVEKLWSVRQQRVYYRRPRYSIQAERPRRINLAGYRGLASALKPQRRPNALGENLPANTLTGYAGLQRAELDSSRPPPDC